MDFDFGFARRFAWIAFVGLIIWWAIQATHYYDFNMASNAVTLSQLATLIFYPITLAPIWYKVVFWLLVFVLLGPYVFMPDAG